mgnify:CR=1 FL=1|jgi:hypothetical protein
MDIFEASKVKHPFNTTYPTFKAIFKSVYAF